jgi:hypothetical protein
VCSVFLFFFFRRYPTDEIRVRDLFDMTGTEEEHLVSPTSSSSVAEGDVEIDQKDVKSMVVNEEHSQDDTTLHEARIE